MQICYFHTLFFIANGINLILMSKILLKLFITVEGVLDVEHDKGKIMKYLVL